MAQTTMPLVGWNIDSPTQRELAIRLLGQPSHDSRHPLLEHCFHVTPDQAHELISELNQVLRKIELTRREAGIPMALGRQPTEYAG